jgi:hypothetical protein
VGGGVARGADVERVGARGQRPCGCFARGEAQGWRSATRRHSSILCEGGARWAPNC